MKSSEPLEQIMSFLLEQTVRQMRGYSQRQLDAQNAGITVDQWVLLKIIEERKQVSQVELAQLSNKDTASITRILDLLQKKNLIERLDDDFDRRKYLISLTTEGKQFTTRMMPVIRKLRSQIVQGFSEKEIQTLKNLLEKIRKNVT